MKRAEFLDIINSGGFGGDRDISGLNELVKLYPWFQSAYSVILNDLFRSGSFNFESSLKKSAIYIADREVLYYLLNGEASYDENKSGISGRVEPELLIGSEKSEAVSSDESLIKEVSSQVRTREELLDEINMRLTEIEQKHSEETILILDDEIIDSDIQEEVVGDEQIVGFDMDLLDLDYPADEEEVVSSSDDQVGSGASESALVDRFLETNPRIEAKADVTVNQLEDITENIDDRSEGLVSETLAGIYLNQKYYTKAILIYEKLSLKYPEKSSYFAAQIEKIKELIS